MTSQPRPVPHPTPAGDSWAGCNQRVITFGTAASHADTLAMLRAQMDVSLQREVRDRDTIARLQEQEEGARRTGDDSS